MKIWETRIRYYAKKKPWILWISKVAQHNIIIELKHGLANRLCSYISASIAAKLQGKKLYVNWIENPLCNCKFNDLFENRIISKNGLLDFDDDTTGRKEYLAENKTMFYEDNLFNKFIKPINAEKDLHDIPFISGKIDDSARLFSKELNLLRPVKEVLESMMDLPVGTVGVHIRTHDLPWWRKEYLQWYLKRFDSILLDNYSHKIFLATDCSSIRKQLQDRYAGLLLTYRNPLSENLGTIDKNRNTTQGIRAALCDLLTLARTERILKTPYSSFGWLASMWNLVPIETPDA